MTIQSKIENLAHDKNHNPSSGNVIKTGSNRGWRLPEKDGKWVRMSGFSEYAKSHEQAIHFDWANRLISLGFRVGKLIYEGTVEFYLLTDESGKPISQHAHSVPNLVTLINLPDNPTIHLPDEESSKKRREAFADWATRGGDYKDHGNNKNE